MTSLLINLYSFGLIPIYFNYLRFTLPAAFVGDGSHSNAYRDLHVIFGYKQWSITLAHLRQQWKTACASCAFVATLSLGFLQITNNSPVYTFALAAIISAGSGLINAASNIWLGPDADSLIFMKKWIEASDSLDRKGSIAFWISLMSPGISLAWAIAFCVCTIISTIWASETGNTFNSGPCGLPHFVSHIFLTLLLILNFLQILLTTRSIRRHAVFTSSCSLPVYCELSKMMP